MREIEIIIMATIIAMLTIVIVSTRGRSLLRVFFLHFSLSQKRRIFIVIMVISVLAIALQISWKNSTPREKLISSMHLVPNDSLLQSLGATQIQALKNIGVLRIDTSISFKHIRPEIAYAIPSVIKSFQAITKKSFIPEIANIPQNNSIVFHTTQSNLSTSQGLQLKHLLQKKMGTDYAISLRKNKKDIQFLKIEYTGQPWNNEKLLSVPVLDAAIAEKVEPALLMAWVQATSHFDIDYKDENGNQGLLALDSGSGFEQLRIGAHLLHQRLERHVNVQDALASIYLGEESLRRKEWWKDPLAKAWVEQILINAQDYRQRGLFLTH
jgi:hypothetical protein